MIDRAGRLAGAAQDGTTTFEYNELGMLLSEGYSGGTLGTRTVSYAYNNGLLLRTNMVMSTHAETEIGYQYDSASRLTNVISGEFTAGYTYHPNSSLLNQTISRHNGTNRLAVARRYDSLNRLQQITSLPGAPDQMPWNYTYSYDQANQHTNVLMADGSKWSYTYDSLGQVTSGKRKWADDTLVAGQQFEYAFDEIGNRVSTKSGGDSNGANLRQSDYTPNLLNQAEDRTVPGYADILGISVSSAAVQVNGSSSGVERKGQYFRKELTVSNSGSAQYPSVSVRVIGGTNSSPTETGNPFVPKAAEIYTYDEDGNLKSDGRWEYTWDAENRLTKLESISGAPSGSARRLEFKYDWCGRRHYKKETDTGSSTILDQRLFVYDGMNLYGELTPAGALLQTYTWGQDLGGGVGGMVGVKPVASSVYFPSYNANGDVVGLTDGSSGVIPASYEYGPFGETTRISGPMGRLNPVRYSTKYSDETSQFIYYGFRYLNPTTGSWLNRDPLAEAGGLNVYGFVGNNPVNLIDAYGLKAGDIWDPLTYWCQTKGFAKGAWNQLEGMYHAVTSPGATIDGLADAIYNYDETGRAIKDAVHQALTRYVQSKQGCIDPCVALEMEGEIVADIAGLFLGGSGLAKLGGKMGKLGEITKLAHLKVAEALAEGERALASEGKLARSAQLVAAEGTEVAGSRFWTTSEFNGKRVYQRNDLIDTALMDARGRSNLERIQKGLAPIGPDGQSMNLHHTIQTADSPLAEVTATFHQKNSAVIHINPNTIPSGIDRGAFDAFRREYWINRAKGFSL